jgi:hypothetical protein
MPFKKTMGDGIIVIKILIYRNYEQPDICQYDTELGEEIFPCRYGIIITLIGKRGYGFEYVKGKIKEKKDNENHKDNGGNLNSPIF